MGEIIGAEIYLTEITKPPARYPIVACISAASAFGTLAALGVATIATNFSFDWRNAFWAGAAIAVIGAVARTKLRETPDFVDMKRRMKISMEEAKHDGLGKAAELLYSLNTFNKEKVDKKTLLAYFLLACASPLSFYFVYVYCSDVLKNTFHFSAAQIIQQNLIMTGVDTLMCIVSVYLSTIMHPLKLLRLKLLCFIPFALIGPILLNNASSASAIFIIQLMALSLRSNPGASVFLPYFPIFKRFTYSSFLYALSRALVYIGTSFSLVYLTEFFGYYGLWIIVIPTVIGFAWGLRHFMKLEKLYNPIMFASPKLQPNRAM